MRRGVAIAWFVIGLAACNAIAGLDGDFSGPDGGGAKPGPSSGSTGGSSGGSSGSSTSGSTTSSAGGDGSSTSSTTSSGGTSTSSSSSSTSSTSSSGGVDAGADAGPPKPFCFRDQDLPYDFCWNFNGTETAAQKWGANEVYAVGADPVVEPNVTGTEKGALHVVNPTDFGSTALVWNVTTADNAKHTRVLEFRFRAVSINYYAVIAAFQLGSGGEHGLAISTKCPGSTSPCFIENQPDGNPRTASNKSLAADTNWHSGLVKMTYSSGTGLWSGEVSVDGAVITSRTDAITAGSQAAGYQVVVGAFFGGQNTGLKTNEVYLDNVRVHLE